MIMQNPSTCGKEKTEDMLLLVCSTILTSSQPSQSHMIEVEGQRFHDKSWRLCLNTAYCDMLGIYSCKLAKVTFKSFFSTQPHFTFHFSRNSKLNGLPTLYCFIVEKNNTEVDVYFCSAIYKWCLEKHTQSACSLLNGCDLSYHWAAPNTVMVYRANQSGAVLCVLFESIITTTSVTNSSMNKHSAHLQCRKISILYYEAAESL